MAEEVESLPPSGGEEAQAEAPPAVIEADPPPVKRGPGRPKGSRNKPKVVVHAIPVDVPAAIPVAEPVAAPEAAAPEAAPEPVVVPVIAPVVEPPTPKRRTRRAEPKAEPAPKRARTPRVDERVVERVVEPPLRETSETMSNILAHHLLAVERQKRQSKEALYRNLVRGVI